jgi:cell division protein FtsB
MKRRESKPPWRRFLIPVLLLLGANLVLLASYTGPRLAEERHSAERLATLRERVEEQRARTETLRERAEATRANAAQLARFYADVVCPDDAARFALVESLEGELRGAGVRAESRRWSSEPAEGLPLERVSGTLPSRGTYGQLTELLGRLERSPEFLIVEQVRLQGREGEAASLDVAVATYCRKREAGT